MFEHLDNPHRRVYSEADRLAITRRITHRRRRRRRARVATLATLGAIVVIAAVTMLGRSRPSDSTVNVATPPPASTTPPTPTTAPPPTTAGAVEKPTGPLQFPEVAISAGPSTIYIVGASDTCGCMALDRTVDNGHRFTRVSLPADVDDENDIGFETASNGYAIGASNLGPAVAWITTNGARTWTPVRLGAHVGIVTATSTPNALYLIADRCGPDGTCRCPHGCDLIRIPTRTPTQSSTFTTSRLPFTASTTLQTSRDGYATDRLGVAAAGTDVWIFVSGKHPTALRSTRSGRNFHRLPTNPTLAKACGYRAATTSVLWADCSSSDHPDDEYRSADAAASFVPVPAPPISRHDTASWDPVDATTVYLSSGNIVGGNAILRRSTNGGTSYTTVADPTTESVCSLTFVTVNRGLALCFAGPHAGAVAYSTTNGGAGWQSDPPL